MKRAPTAKEQVKAVYPNAYAYEWAGTSGWVIYADDGTGTSLNTGATTPRQAWSSALANMKGKKE